MHGVHFLCTFGIQKKCILCKPIKSWASHLSWNITVASHSWPRFWALSMGKRWFDSTMEIPSSPVIIDICTLICRLDWSGMKHSFSVTSLAACVHPTNTYPLGMKGSAACFFWFHPNNFLSSWTLTRKNLRNINCKIYSGLSFFSPTIRAFCAHCGILESF